MPSRIGKWFRPISFIPAGITEVSPGSRSASNENPGCRIPMNSHPERRARTVGHASHCHAFCDPLPGSNLATYKDPRVFVADAPRPGAKIFDPLRDQESKCGYRILKGIARKRELQSAPCRAIRVHQWFQFSLDSNNPDLSHRTRRANPSSSGAAPAVLGIAIPKQPRAR